MIPSIDGFVTIARLATTVRPSADDPTHPTLAADAPATPDDLSVGTFIARAAAQGGLPGARDAARIGRFAVLTQLGEGGMGVVLSAYDELLDRRVALKLLRAPDRGDARLQARLMREAQALARLSHPNIIHVYEAGVSGDELYLAMELVRGVTLSTWLKRQPRSHAEILALFRQCGHGLAAAHRAGLVHRDFKPSNVLVDAEGRARVVDFGLATLAERPEQLALAGTPAYMAPEQWRGEPVDPRSDQFSFCVALWEALTGARPFAGGSFDALREQILAGRLPERGRLPPAIHRALARGLAREPDARYPTLDALLADLDPTPGRGRRLGLALGLTAALGVAAGASTLAARDRCAGGEARLADVWDAPRRAAGHAAVLATGLEFAPAAWESVALRLDARAAEIAAMHRDVCEAHARGEQSDRLLDLRMTCLSRHVREVRALTDLLVDADPGLVERAVDAAADLSSPARCADADALLAELPRPDDPAVAAAVDEVRGDLVELAALQSAGRIDASQSLADAAMRAAEATGHAPLVADALLRRGLLELAGQRHDLAERDLLAAFTRGLAARNEAAARDGAIALVEAELGRGRPSDAELWATLARAALERSPDPTAAAALDLMHGQTLCTLGREREGEALIERSVAASDALHGPDHPATARARVLQGAALLRRQDFARAGTILRDARERLERIHGPVHPAVSIALRHEGHLYYALNEFEAAVATWQRSLEIDRRIHGADADQRSVTRDQIDAALFHLGKLADPLGAARNALAAAERRSGPDHPELFVYLQFYAEAALAAGDAAGARAAIDRATELLRRALGDAHPELARPLLLLADWYRRTGDPVASLPHYERALELRAGTDVDRILRGQAHDGLGRALWSLGRDRTREHLDRAREVYVSLGAAGRVALAEHDRWRTEHLTDAPAPRG